MKIKACQDTSSILVKIHGDSLIDKIISPDCEENFLAELENTIGEIDSFKQKNSIITYKLNNNHNINQQNNNNWNPKNISNNKQHKNYQFEYEPYAEYAYNHETNKKSLEEHQAQLKIPSSNQPNQTNQINPNTHTRQASNISGSRSDLKNLIFCSNAKNQSLKTHKTQESRERLRRSQSKSTLNASRTSKSRSKGNVDFFEDSVGSEAKFEQMLRKYGGRQMSGKVFMNYFRKVGDFFDPQLQKGGNSTLGLKEQGRRRSGSRGRSGSNVNNNSVSVSYSQHNN